MKHDSIKSDFRANLSGIVYIIARIHSTQSHSLVALQALSKAILPINQTLQVINLSHLKMRALDWRVDFNNDEISSIYKDGTRLPDNEIDQHKEMIYEKLGELRSDYKDVDS